MGASHGTEHHIAEPPFPASWRPASFLTRELEWFLACAQLARTPANFHHATITITTTRPSPFIMATTPLPQPTGTKRPSPLNNDRPKKRRRIVHHRLHHDFQSTTCPPTTTHIADTLLEASITTALVLAGFNSATPSALSALHSLTSEFLLHLTSTVRSAMLAARRTKPTPSDFAAALAAVPMLDAARKLEPQTRLKVNRWDRAGGFEWDDAGPSSTTPTPDTFQFLQQADQQRTPVYVPHHFPARPPAHSWIHTPVLPVRERDARRLREWAMAEGVRAEQGLRRLAAAEKVGAKKRGKKVEGKEEGFEEVWREVGGKEGEDGGYGDGGVEVDWEGGFWRGKG